MDPFLPAVALISAVNTFVAGSYRWLRSWPNSQVSTAALPFAVSWNTPASSADSISQIQIPYSPSGQPRASHLTAEQLAA